MASKTQRKPRKFRETLVLYEDPDGRWVSHGLRIDQIGTGDDVIEALADGMKAVESTVALSERRNDIALLRDAPKYVHNIAKGAREFPEEIVSIAEKKAYGEWPRYIDVGVEVPKGNFFKADFVRKIPL